MEIHSNALGHPSIWKCIPIHWGSPIYGNALPCIGVPQFMGMHPHILGYACPYVGPVYGNTNPDVLLLKLRLRLLLLLLLLLLSLLLRLKKFPGIASAKPGESESKWFSAPFGRPPDKLSSGDGRDCECVCVCVGESVCVCVWLELVSWPEVLPPFCSGAHDHGHGGNWENPKFCGPDRGHQR
jgi:hypothetical protein